MVGGLGVGSKFLPLYTSTLLLDRVSQKNVCRVYNLDFQLKEEVREQFGILIDMR